MLDPRYKKSFFQTKAARDNAVERLLEELKEEVGKSGTSDEVVLSNTLIPTKTEVVDTSDFLLKNLMKKVISNSQMEDVQTSGSEEEVLNSYLSTPVEDNNCLDFWKEFEKNSTHEPVKQALARLAKKYLTPPATSTEVERLFSVAGNILSDERNSLKPENVDKLLFLKENLRNLNYKL